MKVYDETQTAKKLPLILRAMQEADGLKIVAVREDGLIMATLLSVNSVGLHLYASAKGAIGDAYDFEGLEFDGHGRLVPRTR